MATETLYAASVFSGSCGTSGNALGAPDGTYTTDADNTSWTCRFNLTALSTGNLTTGTNGQSVTVRTRKETGTGTPSYVLTVYEGGSLVYFGGTTNVTSTTSQDDVFTWTSTGTDGSDIDIQLAVSASGGSPSARTTVQLDAITWTADWAVPPEDKTGTVTGVAPATSGTVTGGTKKSTGTVTGVAPATSGTVAGTKKSTGTVTGVAPATSGVLTSPDKGGKGSVTGSASASGTVVGTKFEPSNDKSGTVTGVAPATSGTVAGAKGGNGTVTGLAPATSGTVVGSEGSRGTVTGSATASGTVAGEKATTGTITGSASASGTVDGTADYPDRIGSVTGSASASGTVAGKKGASGTATGAATASGTVAGRSGRLGSVTGAATASGTVTGTVDYPDRFGTVVGSVTAPAGTITGSTQRDGTITGQATASGTVVGTAYDPNAPVPDAGPSGGGRNYYQAAALPKPIAKTGRVRGTAYAYGYARGHRGQSGTVVGTCTITATARGTHGYRGWIRGHAPAATVEVRATQTAPRDAEYLLLHAEVRRLRHENELLLTL